MSFERGLINKELDAVKKEIKRYKKDKDMLVVLGHIENIYGLVYTLYKKAKLVK